MVNAEILANSATEAKVMGYDDAVKYGIESAYPAVLSFDASEFHVDRLSIKPDILLSQNRTLFKPQIPV